MAMSEFSELKQKTSNIESAIKNLEELNKKLEEEIQKLDANTQNILRVSQSNLELAKKTLESKGRKILFISIGSASALGNKKINEKLAKGRAGVGDFYSPKNVSMKEYERYQHTRLIAVYETEQMPNLPAEPMK
jgi:hypothetical protein